MFGSQEIVFVFVFFLLFLTTHKKKPGKSFLSRRVGRGPPGTHDHDTSCVYRVADRWFSSGRTTGPFIFPSESTISTSLGERVRIDGRGKQKLSEMVTFLLPITNSLLKHGLWQDSWNYIIELEVCYHSLLTIEIREKVSILPFVERTLVCLENSIPWSQV